LSRNLPSKLQKKIEAISPAMMKGLMAWDWPGNIRELENFIERAVIVTRGKSLDAPLGELRKANTVDTACPPARNQSERWRQAKFGKRQNQRC